MCAAAEREVAGSAIPPTGKNPVRTANINSARAISRSGIESRSDMLPRTKLPSGRLRLPATTTPMSSAAHHDTTEAIVASNNVFFIRGHRSEPTGIPYANEKPSSPRKTDRSQFKYWTATG